MKRMSRNPHKREQLIQQMIIDALLGREVTYISPSQEQAESLMHEVAERLKTPKKENE